MATNYDLSPERIQEVLYKHPELGITSETVSGRQMYRQKANPKAIGVWISRKNVYDIVNRTLDKVIKSRRGVLIDRRRNPQALVRFMQGRHESPLIAVENQYIDGSELDEILALEKDEVYDEVDVDVLEVEEVVSLDEADAGIEKLLNDYQRESKENSQSWAGFKKVKYKVAQKEYEEGSADDLVKKLVDKYDPHKWEDYSGKNVVSPSNIRSFKAYCAVEPKQPVHDDVKKNKQNYTVQIDSYEIDPAELKELPQLSPELSYAHQLPLEKPVVVRKPFKKKVRDAVAQAAFIAGGVLAAFSGYQAMKMTADNPIEYYHGIPAVAAAVTKVEVKESIIKTSEVKPVEPQTKRLEVPTAITVKKAPQKKVSKTADELYDEWSKFYDQYRDHEVRVNDTIMGLWENSYQGDLAFNDYLREVMKQNPSLNNPDKIWPGQTLTVPSNHDRNTPR